MSIDTLQSRLGQPKKGHGGRHVAKVESGEIADKIFVPEKVFDQLIAEVTQ